jgi:3-isopropylmalate/(R)-2-methylmalate dehydratase small subunit
MEAFKIIVGIAAPLLQANVDTDQIAPGRSMMKLDKAGAGVGLFANWRYDEGGAENPEFVLNRVPYRHAQFLIGGANFGCGSSREFAVWALRDFGIRAIIAPSFGAIFASNCYINGVVPVVLEASTVAAIGAELSEESNTLSVDLVNCRVLSPNGQVYPFNVPELQREMLLEGLDAIDLTLKRSIQIAEFQRLDALKRPWVY